MLDSGASKLSENRMHLYDPVGLINDNYGSLKSSSYEVRPRRPTMSYDNFADTTTSTTTNNTPLELKSNNRFVDHANTNGDLRSYDSFEVDSLDLISYEGFNKETNGGRISSHDHSSSIPTTEDRNDGGLRFIVVDTVVEDDQSDSSTPRLWKPTSPTSPKSLPSSPHHSTSPKSLPSSPHQSTSPKSLPSSPHHSISTLNSLPSSPHHFTSPKSLPSHHHHSTSPKSVVNSPPPLHLSNSPKSVVSSPHIHPHNSPTSVVNSSPLPLHPPNNPKSVNFSPLNPPIIKSVTSYTQTSLNRHHYQTMTPNSRTQAIAKGRRELMDMVRDLPETFYELSLKDIVEQKPELEMTKEINIPEEKKPVKEATKPKETKKQKKSSKKVKKSESKKKMVRSRSVDNGKFLLKTSVFPILGSRKSKKSLTTASSFKVAPMPKAETTGHTKVGEKDWWRRRSCISSERDDSNALSSQRTSSHSSTSSSRSNSSSERRSNRFLPSCCLFNGRRISGKK